MNSSILGAPHFVVFEMWDPARRRRRLPDCRELLSPFKLVPSSRGTGPTSRKNREKWGTRRTAVLARRRIVVRARHWRDSIRRSTLTHKEAYPRPICRFAVFSVGADMSPSRSAL